MISVGVEAVHDESGEEALLAKFSDGGWEIDVRAPASELLILRDIRTFDWDTRRPAKVGICAGASAFWCSDGKTATILVGHDDEAWDVAVSVPVEVIDDLVRQIDPQAN